MNKLIFRLLTCCVFPLYLYASGNNPDSTSSTIDSSVMKELLQFIEQDSIVKSLDYKTGTIPLGNDLATITVPEGFAFLNAKDGQYILTDVWGNPADESVMGLLVPKNISMLEAESWAVVYTYDEDGHIKDDDALEINYDEMLTDMQKESKEANEARVKAGYNRIELIGWAQKPFYDKASHKLHWAKELKFGTDSLNTLNYNIRMLGRKGVLVMNIVSGMDNMQIVQANINKILASTNFNSGSRYQDFDSSMDKVAEYGIGGLIAGGILAKTGLLAKIGIFFLKAWKIIALGALGIFGAFRKKIFGSKNGN